MAAEDWYVPATVEFDDTLKAHIIRAGVPDDVYAIPSAWDQEEVEIGLWILHFRESVNLTAGQRLRMRLMGCKPVDEGKPTRATFLRDRLIALQDQE